MTAAPARLGAVTPARVRVLADGHATTRGDVVATEEPLQIMLEAGGLSQEVAVTMRTPGHDLELAAGFLRAEGLVAGPGDVRRIDHCADADRGADGRGNVVTVHLRAPVLPGLGRLERYGTVSSACGVCGKASLDALSTQGIAPLDPRALVVDAEVIYALPDRLRAAQGAFRSTGGLHAAGLFAPGGEAMVVREDVGRHNAVDKVVGWAFVNDRLDEAAQGVLVVSGRAGFEIVQKAAATGIPIVCAVSAPTSLAVAVAEQFGVTLVAFLRGRRANVYAGAQRLT